MVYSPKPRSDVFCSKLNFKISKLGSLRASSRAWAQGLGEGEGEGVGEGRERELAAMPHKFECLRQKIDGRC